MLKLIVVMLFAFLVAPTIGRATDFSFDNIISLINMKQGEATPDDITSKFGHPAKVEEGRKTHIWYYNTAKGKLAIYFTNDDLKVEKISFETAVGATINELDNKYAPYLKTGKSKICEVLGALGTPRNMTIKHVNQDLHYSFQNRILHLFFRKGILVNYSFF